MRQIEAGWLATTAISDGDGDGDDDIDGQLIIMRPGTPLMSCPALPSFTLSPPSSCACAPQSSQTAPGSVSAASGARRVFGARCSDLVGSVISRKCGSRSVLEPLSAVDVLDVLRACVC